MPYLLQQERRNIVKRIDEIDMLCVPCIRSGAALNFAICFLADKMIEYKGLRYSTLQEIIGALECAKAELYRRVAGPYEDLKIEENGEVLVAARNMLGQAQDYRRIPDGNA